jgi:hypothetical protein
VNPRAGLGEVAKRKIPDPIENRTPVTQPVSGHFTDSAIPTHMSNMKVNPKVSGLAAWSENCKYYSSLPLRAVVSLLCGSV